MTTINDVFDLEVLSKTEEAQIIEVFSSGIVKKYLKIMAKNDIKDLAVLSVTERNSEELARKHALVQGKLAVLTTLLSIQKS